MKNLEAQKAPLWAWLSGLLDSMLWYKEPKPWRFLSMDQEQLAYPTAVEPQTLKIMAFHQSTKHKSASSKYAKHFSFAETEFLWKSILLGHFWSALFLTLYFTSFWEIEENPKLSWKSYKSLLFLWYWHSLHLNQKKWPSRLSAFEINEARNLKRSQKTEDCPYCKRNTKMGYTWQELNVVQLQ